MHLPVFTALISVASAVLIQGPPGPYSVARKVQSFEDPARWDPLAPADKPEKRRVATSAFIPVKKGNCSDDVVPYMTPITAKAMAGFSASLGFALPDDFFDNLEMAFCKTRRADFSFVIDKLQTPDVAAQLMASTGASIDSDKVFVYGHSLGGATSAATILTDDRVLGGLNFDGAMYGPVPTEGSDKLLVLAGQPVLPQTVFPGVPSWNETYDKHQGPALIVTINGTMHPTFLDAPQLPPIKELLKNPDYTAALQGFLGTIDGDRAGQLTIDIVRTALHSVFDGKKDELCNIEKLGPELDLLKIKGLGCPQE
ncbi:putative 1-alkyl-2-acetylglycerophosphocholine esterase [Colletotrichum sp. SAR 10_99]|nr:putative 1-alkyl-2-acetylglycerophosphocholine esterase [Colletotrichum sp. SAR 10_96]KAI8293381.1 putative 1-alkyl-2-acetylglycerophosphocholine esterase [Colletotrichum sp. SAR 10_98]KAJ5018809.1 putative 1-alkyl-2-acetylglycerophosphocholine esterase [Colletotrichum sp. SAR 10_99]